MSSALAAGEPSVSWGHQAREGTAPLCSGLGLPHPESCALFWAPQCEKDTELLESIQRRRIRTGKGLEGKPYKERLRALCSPWRRLRGDLTAVFNILRRGRGGAGTDLISGDQGHNSRKQSCVGGGLGWISGAASSP